MTSSSPHAKATRTPPLPPPLPEASPRSTTGSLSRPTDGSLLPQRGCSRDFCVWSRALAVRGRSQHSRGTTVSVKCPVLAVPWEGGSASGLAVCSGGRGASEYQFLFLTNTTYGSIVSHSARDSRLGRYAYLTCASDTALVTRSLRGTPALRMRAARPRAGLARLRSYGAASIASPVRGSRGTAPSWRSRRRTRRDGRTARRCASLGW